MRPQRAIEARELITDLGVTFIKIAQVWASRPDILPKESPGRSSRERATDDLAFCGCPRCMWTWVVFFVAVPHAKLVLSTECQDLFVLAFMV